MRSAAEIEGLADGWRERRWLDAEDAKVRAIVAEWMADRRAAAVAAGRPVPEPLALHDPTNRTAGDMDRLGDARLLISAGYSIEHVCRRTGWGGWWLADLVGNDGYYARPA